MLYSFLSRFSRFLQLLWFILVESGGVPWEMRTLRTWRVWLSFLVTSWCESSGEFEWTDFLQRQKQGKNKVALTSYKTSSIFGDPAFFITHHIYKHSHTFQGTQLGCNQNHTTYQTTKSQLEQSQKEMKWCIDSRKIREMLVMGKGSRRPIKVHNYAHKSNERHTSNDSTVEAAKVETKPSENHSSREWKAT